MSNHKKAAQGSAATAEATVKFSNMSVGQKIAHIGKACVFFLSFGFAFPNVFSD